MDRSTLILLIEIEPTQTLSETLNRFKTTMKLIEKFKHDPIIKERNPNLMTINKNYVY